jgi:hypothetical protein
MKQHFSLLLFLFIIIIIPLKAQEWNIHAEAGLGYAAGNKVRGENTYGHGYLMNSPSGELSVEYRNTRGMIYALSGGFQEETFSFSEKMSDAGFVFSPLIFVKTYKTFPLKISAGYFRELWVRGFCVTGKVGFGVAYVQSNDVSYEYAFDGLVNVIRSDEPPYLTNAHTYIKVEDPGKKKFLPQANLTFGGEYHFRSLFTGIYCEGRSWMSASDEIIYHTEHSDSYKNFSRVADGRVSILNSYLGWKVMLGWRFGRIRM